MIPSYNVYGMQMVEGTFAFHFTYSLADLFSTENSQGQTMVRGEKDNTVLVGKQNKYPFPTLQDTVFAPEWGFMSSFFEQSWISALDQKQSCL